MDIMDYCQDLRLLILRQAGGDSNHNLKESIEWLCKELNLYKQALTQAVSLPKGVLPNTKKWYTWMDSGNCVIETVSNQSLNQTDVTGDQEVGGDSSAG